MLLYVLFLLAFASLGDFLLVDRFVWIWDFPFYDLLISRYFSPMGVALRGSNAIKAVGGPRYFVAKKFRKVPLAMG